MHDLVHLERHGIPAVGIATAPFADDAIEQARRLGIPGCRMVYVPRPVQLRPTPNWPPRPTPSSPR